MMKLPLVGIEIPFVGRLFWKILPAVLVLVVVTFWVCVKFFDYEMTNADYGGSFISGVIFSYLLHLWMLPADAYPDFEEEYEEYEDEEWEDEEDSDSNEETTAQATPSAPPNAIADRPQGGAEHELHAKKDPA